MDDVMCAIGLEGNISAETMDQIECVELEEVGSQVRN